MELKFPRHKCGLYLQHNPHLDLYQTVAEYITESDGFDFMNDGAKYRSMFMNELWILKWYPDTPVGSYEVAAPTLVELLQYALLFE